MTGALTADIRCGSVFGEMRLSDGLTVRPFAIDQSCTTWMRCSCSSVVRVGGYSSSLVEAIAAFGKNLRFKVDLARSNDEANIFIYIKYVTRS